jgi:hypothetical protein
MRKQNRSALGVLFGAVLMLASAARSGHEVPVYPSYYPHEITIETVLPEGAAAQLQATKIQAYLGREPLYATEPPKPVRAVESLGNFIVIRVERETAEVTGDACPAMDAAIAALADKRDLLFHPYPVTPFHGDYLNHTDRATAAKAKYAVRHAEPMPVGWSAALDKVDAAAMFDSSVTAVNGWLGPAWAKAGWYQAWLLLGDALVGDARQRAEVVVDRLMAGDYRDAVERINLERALVGTLEDNCRKRVVGYTKNRQYFSAEFTNGIENIGFDSIAGLDSPMFLRTVKLKNFPWNGWLALGVDAAPLAAWNPIGGFDDNFGRLLWSALGDPAELPAPYDAGWILNRASDVRADP